MAADKGNAIKWVATRKVDDYLEYLVSHTAWNPDKRFAKIFDTSELSINEAVDKVFSYIQTKI